MDKELFKQKLTEVADWHIPKLCQTDIKASEKAKRGRGRPTEEEKYQDEHEEVFLELFNGINPTHTPELTKTKIAATTCDDCGAHCPNGRKKEKKLYQTGNKKNWRERCVTCQMAKNPFTGKFDMTLQQAPHIWTDFLKDRKGVYNTEKNQAIKDSGIITSYVDKEQSDK